MLVFKVKTLLNNNFTVKQVKQLHAVILVNGLTHLESLLVSQILNSQSNYCQNTSRYVQSVVKQMQKPDVFSLASAIRLFCQHGQFREAFAQYVHIQKAGLLASSFAISSALKACSKLVDWVGGTAIHAQTHRYGLNGDVYVQTALVGFYSKLGTMKTAGKMFDEMTDRNVVSWNSMLDGYLKCGDLSMAETFFDKMLEKDVVSWNSMVSGYGRAGNMKRASSLFQQMPERSSASWNAIITGYVDSENLALARSFYDAMPQRNHVSCVIMIAGYSKCGNVKSARELYDQMVNKNQVLYNAMIACYAQNSQPKEAVNLFKEMLLPNVNIQPDKMTLVSVISASSQLGDFTYGSWLESYMNKVGINMDDHLTTALIDLYAKGGSIDKAFHLFRSLQKKDVVSYTAMVLGCGINGRVTDAIQLFEEMMSAEINPNLVTFTGLLTAFNHVGLVEEGYHCFNSMKKYGLVPSADQYSIMVGLLGRAGKLEEAYELIKSMPMQPHAGVWGALLLACNIHNNVEFGEIAAKHCFELEPDSTGYGSLLANIYAAALRWDDAKRLRLDVQEMGFAKVPGSSWMDNGLSY